MANTTGRIFCVTTFGESHGTGLGAIVDGCPSQLEISEQDIQKQMDRRRPGQSGLTTPRKEADEVTILSGVEHGLTLGSPIALVLHNTNRKPDDYKDISNVPRPSHADYSYRLRYGIAASSGGGRASARETAGRVAAGAIAEKFLLDRHNIEIVAWVSSVGAITAEDVSPEYVTRADVDSQSVRCPDEAAAARMTEVIRQAADDGDSIGGIVTCVCRNVPGGIGEPVFDKVEACLAAAMLSIPACKGFDIGSGFDGAGMLGSENNDMYVMKEGGRLGTVTNRSGGVQGGISNGEPIVFRAAFKPTATIRKAQQTVDYEGNDVLFELEKGRHDPCVLPRAVPVVESMAALILADLVLLAGK